MTELLPVDALDQHVGRMGRMLSGGKQAKPGHEVYWNACVFLADGLQIWYGDLDLTTESEAMQKAADACGEVLILTPEQPFRFSGLNGEREEDRDRIRRFEPNGAGK